MYAVELRARAEKDIAALSSSVRRRVLDAIAGLSANPRPPGMRALEAVGGYRLRVGDYRVLLEIDDEARRVTVVRVKHRKDVYRKL